MLIVWLMVTPSPFGRAYCIHLQGTGYVDVVPKKTVREEHQNLVPDL